MTSDAGSLTHPLSDPDEELAAARAELERARDRVTRHATRPGGADPHTHEWLSRAERRVSAAEARLVDQDDDSDLAEPGEPPYFYHYGGQPRHSLWWTWIAPRTAS